MPIISLNMMLIRKFLIYCTLIYFYMVAVRNLTEAECILYCYPSGCSCTNINDLKLFANASIEIKKEVIENATSKMNPLVPK